MNEIRKAIEGLVGSDRRSLERQYYLDSLVIRSLDVHYQREQNGEAVDWGQVVIDTAEQFRADPTELAQAIIGGYHQIRNMEHIVHAKSIEADEDPLTKLPNRRKFDRELERLITVEEGRSLAVPSRLAVIHLDIDDFKKYNRAEYGGQPSGDSVMRQFGQVMNAVAKPSETGCLPARLGGDEFAIIVPSYLEHEKVRYTGVVLAHALLDALRAYSFAHTTSTSIVEHGERKIRERVMMLPQVTASIGVTGYDRGGYEYYDYWDREQTHKAPDSPEDMNVRADRAAKYSKKAGKNRVSIFKDARSALFKPHVDRPLSERATLAVKRFYEAITGKED
jgi:diguanylate cyclase (GGDEF)-like protein